jgi:hypothetical protein
MKRQQLYLSALIWIVSSFCAFGQGTIQMLNGKEKRYINYQIQDEYVVFQRESNPEGSKKRIDRFNVFSIIPDNGQEVVVYDPDTTDGIDLSIMEARDFIAGEKLALLKYNEPDGYVVGFQLGLFCSTLGFYGIPIPVVYSTLLGRFSPKFPETHGDKVYSEAFVAGYQKKARTMKINKSLLGGGIGFAVGLTALILIVD